MEIKLTQKQYQDLLRALYLADWMANAVCISKDEEDKGIKDLMDHVFSLGAEDTEDVEDLIAEFDDDPFLQKLIERYDEDTAWHELIEMLGERDFFRKYSREERMAMNDDEFFKATFECEAPWEEEFAEYGITRLAVEEKQGGVVSKYY